MHRNGGQKGKQHIMHGKTFRIHNQGSQEATELIKGGFSNERLGHCRRGCTGTPPWWAGRPP